MKKNLGVMEVTVGLTMGRWVEMEMVGFWEQGHQAS